MTPEILNWIVRALLFIVCLLTAFAYLTLTERRVLAWFQWRCGPNRVGPLGLFQPIADGIKTVLKQEAIPRKADKLLFLAAPVITFAAGFSMFAVIPVGKDVWLSNVAVGALIFLGFSSFGAYGLIIAGWASQSKYPFLGAMRACAQVISYELSLGLALLVPILIVGSLNIVDIGNIYYSDHWHIVYLLPLSGAFILFLIAALAETGRVPFDLPECESEVVAGYHTEYSSLKYAMFPMGEYIAMCGMSAIAVHMFLGGWHLPFISDEMLQSYIGGMALYPPAFLGLSQEYMNALSWTAMGFVTTMVFLGKMMFLILVFMWIRATEPRFRYDQLMSFGWKRMLPVGFALVLLTAIMLAVVPEVKAVDPVMEVGLYGER